MRRATGSAVLLLLLSCRPAAPPPERPEPRTALGAAQRADWVTPTPWTHFLGSHYQPAPWARGVRDIGRRVVTGVPPDTLGGTRGAISLDQYATRLRLVAPTADLVELVGGLGSARDPESVIAFLERVESDGGENWRRVIRRRSAAAKQVIDQARGLYWQIGNEINSRHFAESLDAWRGISGKPRLNHPAIISVYVEYFFAPAVDALRGFDWGSDDRAARSHVMLGSVANAYNPASRAWLEQLLRYRIRGDYAPRLAGKRVAELIDVISIHYLVTADDRSWMPALDSLQRRWVDSAGVTGVWATEELGAQRANADLGAVTALKVTARYLHWWHLRKLTPERSRAFFWGADRGRPGARGEDALEVLFDALGTVPWVDITDRVGTPPNVEAYGFQAATSRATRALILLPSPLESAVALDAIEIAGSVQTEVDSATIHVFDASGRRTLRAPVSSQPGRQRIVLPGDFTLLDASAVLLLLDALPTRSHD